VRCAANTFFFASQRRLFCAGELRTELYNEWFDGTIYFRYILLKTQETCIKSHYILRIAFYDNITGRKQTFEWFSGFSHGKNPVPDTGFRRSLQRWRRIKLCEISQNA